MGYQEEVQGGVKWLSVSMVVTRATRLVTTLVLARLLVPEMFGLVAMAHVLLGILHTVRETGFGAAYIQRQESDPERDRLAANTTFWLGILINGSLYLGATALAPYGAAFFRSPEVEMVLRVMFLTIAMDAIIMVPALDLEKRMDFRRLAVCEVIQAVSYAVVGVALAFVGAGVWSLVAAELGAKVVFMAGLLRMSSWRPRLEFDGKIARELFAYGKYLWAFVILSGIGDALDKLIIGRYFGEADLGVYSMAFLLSTFTAKHITSVVNRLTFPLFSKMQFDMPTLKTALMKTLAHVSTISLPISLGLLAVAPSLVAALLGAKWAGMVPLIGVLVYYGLFLSVSAATGPALKAIGKPNVLFYTSVAHHIIRICLLILLRNYGVLGICYAVLVPILVSSIVAFVLIGKYFTLSAVEMAVPILRPVIAAVAMYGCVRLFGHLAEALGGLAPMAELVYSVLLGVAVYLGISVLTNRDVLVEMGDSFGRQLLRGRATA